MESKQKIYRGIMGVASIIWSAVVCIVSLIFCIVYCITAEPAVMLLFLPVMIITAIGTGIAAAFALINFDSVFGKISCGLSGAAIISLMIAFLQLL